MLGRQVIHCLKALKQAGAGYAAHGVAHNDAYDVEADPRAIIADHGFTDAGALKARALAYANRGPGGAPRICKLYELVFMAPLLEMTVATVSQRAEHAAKMAKKAEEHAKFLRQRSVELADEAMQLVCAESDLSQSSGCSTDPMPEDDGSGA
jgi:hypothetical protein